MYFSFATLFFFIACISSAFSRTDFISPPAQCDPNTIEDAPYQLRNICLALSKIYRISNAMETYLDDLPPQQLQYLRAGSNSDVKRKDLDHVFLRFGRRRR